MTMPRVALALTAAGFIGFGSAFSFWPELANVVEISLPTATARIDLAATYGGFELGFGAFLVLALLRPAWIEAGLWAGALALAGFATVRLVSLIVSNAAVRPAIYLALTLEVAGVVLNLWSLRLLRRGRSPA